MFLGVKRILSPSASMLHLPSSVSLLSAMRYNRFCASLKWLKIMTGTSAIFKACAAASRPWPAMISKFSSTRIGFINPNSRMESAIFRSCRRLCCFGLLAYPCNWDMGVWVIVSSFIVFYPFFIRSRQTHS